MTPIERHGGVWVKRDDAFLFNGVRGGKVRTCLAIATAPPHPRGLVTAGSRHSPQVHIVAAVGQFLCLPVRVHVPAGADTPEVLAAVALGAGVVRHRPGYNSVIVARARGDAESSRGWRLVPFGMECSEAVEQTASQVPATMPEGVGRVVVPVGSGMSLAGVYQGMVDRGHDQPILGVVVGASPVSRLDAYAPTWRISRRVELVNSSLAYGRLRVGVRLGGVELDPVYEAKCIEFLQEGDLLWVVGRRTA